MAKTILFSDIKMEIEFLEHNKPFNRVLSNKIDYDKFKLKFLKKKNANFCKSNNKSDIKIIHSPNFLTIMNKYSKLRKNRDGVSSMKNEKVLSNTVAYTSLKLLDIHGEFLMKNLF